jgi:hypothetical protein
VSHYYLDASALVKRYVGEVGSDWLRATIAPAQPSLLFTSRMTIVEVISAFARRARDGSLSSEEFAIARDAFQSDCLNEYQIMPPSMAIIVWLVLCRSSIRCAPTTRPTWRQRSVHNNSSRRKVTHPSSFSLPMTV